MSASRVSQPAQPPEGGTTNSFPVESHMNTVWQDLRYGARMLMKKPGFTLIAVITLAAGIAANTTIFSLTDALILRPFNFQNQDRLVMIWERGAAGLLDSGATGDKSGSDDLSSM
jgi:hypothetical protein